MMTFHFTTASLCTHTLATIITVIRRADDDAEVEDDAHEHKFLVV